MYTKTRGGVRASEATAAHDNQALSSRNPACSTIG
jgi:hypothetical protein